MEFIKDYESDSNEDNNLEELADFIDSNDKHDIHNTVDKKLQIIKKLKDDFSKSLLPDYESIFKKLYNNKNLNYMINNKTINLGLAENKVSNNEFDKPVTKETLTGVLELNKMEKLDFNKQYFNKNNKKLKLNREKYGDPSDINRFKGSWGKFSEEQHFKQNVNMNNYNENTEIFNETNSKLDLDLIEKNEDEFDYSSVFHLKDEYDTLGKSYLEVPTNLKQTHQATNYIPKKLVHTYDGHKDKVFKLDFFPKYGHYFLSCSQDKTIKLWDVLNHKKCTRTYIGNTDAVKDISFSSRGKTFSSISIDKRLVYWDTETGAAINVYKCEKVPLCCKINPDENHNNDILVGTSNKSVSNLK